MISLDALHFDERGLMPVVVQDDVTGEVLMLAYASREALEKTLETGEAHFYSRSRKSLWHKGETSGQFLRVSEVATDCDEDALLYRVIAEKGACHRGTHSCFDTEGRPLLGWLGSLEGVIRQRQAAGDTASSYVARMSAAGLDRVLQKVGEEAGEFIIAAKNRTPGPAAEEASDLLFHMLLALSCIDLGLTDLLSVLSGRRG